MQTKKIYFVANARMPTEKAHGIHIAKMCEALIEAGEEVTLIVPARSTDRKSLREYYGLRVDVPTVRLWALEWFNYGRIGYRIASWSFMLSYVLWLRRNLPGGAILYTVDTDTFSSAALGLLRAPLFSEMHGGKPNKFATRFLFARARGIISINAHIAHMLQKTFPRSRAAYAVEPNGVDLAQFAPQDRVAARGVIGVPIEEKVVLYTGRFFDWKGLEVLSEAAGLTPELTWYVVGGTRDEFMRLVPGEAPPNMRFMGGRPHREIPTWLAAADALVVLGTKRDIQSYEYTSPMKLFEYLAIGTPVAASATPAIRHIVSEREVALWEPDNAQDLADKVRYCIAHPDSARAAAARTFARAHTWQSRGQRIAAFIEEHTDHA